MPFACTTAAKGVDHPSVVLNVDVTSNTGRTMTELFVSSLGDVGIKFAPEIVLDGGVAVVEDVEVDVVEVVDVVVEVVLVVRLQKLGAGCTQNGSVSL